MHIKKQPDSAVKPSEITPEAVYRSRRRFIGAGAGLAALGLAPAIVPRIASGAVLSGGARGFGDLPASIYNTDEELTDYKSVTTYNNFYELGYDKAAPHKNAEHLITEPWSVTVDGLCENPGKFALEDFVKDARLEERIYRLRCVEAWSMVIPWVGFPLRDVVERAKPLSGAKYVAFFSIHDPENLPGQRRGVLRWPYREGLRIDEAVNPLTLLTVGLYGKVLPNQNGAPLRLVVPWKYGFKSIKSVVAMRFVEEVPQTSWNMSQPREYGFYSNVNPDVSHPRWSQRRERRIGEFRKRKTLPFNGYAKEVADMYAGMDLRKHF